jgi:TrmH family RNA methyltransferase
MALTKAELKYLTSLQTKKGRKKEGRFLIEGVRLLEDALAADHLPHTILYAPSEMTERGRELVKKFVARKVTAQTISARECHRLADTKTSQGIIALFSFPRHSLRQHLAKGMRKILICDGIGDPGNLGTLIRSAAAFHFDLVVTTAGSAEAGNPKTIRAGMGAFFRIPVIDGVDAEELASELKKAGYTIYNADAKGKYIRPSLPMADKLALVVGSEATGTGAVLAAEARFRIKVPMAKSVESLNSAMAGTVLMFWFDTVERTAK